MDTAQAIKELQQLKPLPKPHPSWPFYGDDGPAKYAMWQPENRELLRELVRVTGSIPLQAEAAVTPGHLAIVQKEFPETPVCATFRSYREMAAKKLPATELGPEWRKDVDDLISQCARLAPLREQVAHVHFDIEHWSTARDDLDALRMHFALCYRLAKQTFPKAAVFFYGHGAMRRVNADHVHEPSPYVPLDAPADCYSTSLYGESLLSRQERFVRCLNYAGDGKPWCVMVALGYAARANWRSQNIFGPPGIGIDTAYRLGFELNFPWAADLRRRERFPLSAAEIVYLYPCPTIEKYPDFLPEFVAYVKGAHNVPLS